MKKIASDPPPETAQQRQDVIERRKQLVQANRDAILSASKSAQKPKKAKPQKR